MSTPDRLRPAAGNETGRPGVVPGVAEPVRVLLVPGSLRRQSTSLAVLRTAQVVAPRHLVTVLFGRLGDLPLFNPDDDEEPLDPAVADLRAEIRAADALMVSTPEYAGALPGAFKNLLDWTVGDDRPGSIYEKPVGWINASPAGRPMPTSACAGCSATCTPPSSSRPAATSRSPRIWSTTRG